MLGLAARPAKTRGKMMRDELGESWEHFVQAATHAANGMGATVGPTTGRIRGAASRSLESTTSAFAPMAAAYRAGTLDAGLGSGRSKGRRKAQKREKQMSRNRVGMLIGLLAAGAAVGAGAALLMRRRRRQQWSEYDPSQALESVRSDAESMAGPSVGSMSRMEESAEKADDYTSRAEGRDIRP